MSLTGSVVDGSGQPLEGVTVSTTDTRCSTQTDASGQFVLACEPGTFDLTFSKSNHIGSQTQVVAPEKVAYPVPTQTMTKIPESHGLFVLKNGQYEAIQSGTIKRTLRKNGETLQRSYCLQDGTQKPTRMKKGTVTLFDHQASSWRLFRLDADRCAYRDTRNAQGRWVVAYREKPLLKAKTLGKQLVLHRTKLRPGHYFAANWKGFFSPTDTDSSLYDGFWIQVED